MNVFETTMTSSEAVVGGDLLMGSAPAVSCAAVEIVVMWNGVVQEVVHREVGEKKGSRFTIGEEPSCDFAVPAEYLAGMTSMTLVDIGGDEAVVTLPPGVSGEMVHPGGQVRSIEEIDRRSFTVLEGHRTVFELGPWTFLVRATGRTSRFSAPGRIDWTPNLFAGVSVAIHALFFGIISLIPPGANGLINDPDNSSNRFAKYMIVPNEVKMEAVPEMLEKKEEEKEVDLGVAATGTVGQAGDRKAERNNKRYGIQGPPDTRQIRMARDTAKDLAQSAGILQYISSQTVTSPFGSDNPMGRDPENALGGLLGDEIGANFGYGGLNMWGTGRGGGGDAIGTIGIGNLNRITSGFINANKNPYKNRPPRFDGTRRPTSPIVRSVTGGVIKGSIPKDVIRRLVHRQLPQIKYCYEKGLASHPELEGRISIRFVISPKGVVQTALVSSSTIGDASVEKCIAGAVQRITFPEPADGGVVIATYPFSLTSPNN